MEVSSARAVLRAALGAAALACAASAPAAAQDPGPIRSALRAGPLRVDGRLDEEAWKAAPPYDAFVESFPRAGLSGDPRTEVRVLHDDEAIYVAVRCEDPEPARILRPLARRDANPTADRVEVAYDPGASGRTAYLFSVNAAGVLRDLLLYGDVSWTDSWDAVWTGAATVDGMGWSAELAIPLRQLRGASAGRPWTVHVRRFLPRTHQVLDSVRVPREANRAEAGALVVSRFGPLEGLAEVEPVRGPELLPYVATRATLRPQYSDPARPDPRLVDPALEVGLDFRAPLGQRLTLAGALNPDFGQVESDKVIQNLSTVEEFFPEKRPFFQEGLGVFRPVGIEYGSQQQLFYSRRIGLSAPILGAAKVAGSPGDGLEVGALDAVVMGEGNASLRRAALLDPSGLPALEADPDRRLRFRWRQPFHLAPENALPPLRPVATNYLAAVGRRRLGPATVGATVTAATPLEPRCRRSDFQSDAEYASVDCTSSGANALALDLDVPGEWGGFGQLSVTQATGGPAEGRLLRDGTRLRDGDLGFGGHFRAGKLGGEPWRFDVVYVYLGRKLDLNAVGFQPFSDYQWVDLDLSWVRPNGLGKLHSFQVSYFLDWNYAADLEWLPRGLNTNVFAKAQLPGYQTVAVRVGLENLQYDTREIAFSGVPFQRDGSWFAALEIGSDPSRALQAVGDVTYWETLGHERFARESGVGGNVTLTWQPHARLETRLEGSYAYRPQGPRWVETQPDGTAVFGLLRPEFLSLTLRQQFVFTPRLSTQLYAQLFSQSVRWAGQFYGASLEGRSRLPLAALAPVDFSGDPSGHDAVVNLNAVLRWEYRLGSTLFLVYTRSQSELPPPDGPPPASIAAPRLFQGPVTETFLVKWTYWRG